jgi:hypothetical protein
LGVEGTEGGSVAGEHGGPPLVERCEELGAGGGGKEERNQEES